MEIGLTGVATVVAVVVDAAVVGAAAVDAVVGRIVGGPGDYYCC